MEFVLLILYAALVTFWGPPFPWPFVVMTLLSFYHSSPKDTILSLLGIHLIATAVIFAVSFLLAVIFGISPLIPLQVALGFLAGKFLGLLRPFIKI